jgi:mono/diheme cytochrome c family protein
VERVFPRAAEAAVVRIGRTGTRLQTTWQDMAADWNSSMIIALALLAGLFAAAQLPSTPESRAAGQQLYMRNCASCHGRTAEGGPGNDLIPAAPSLVGEQWEHGSTDKAIFDNIKNGIAPDFNMVAFKNKLTDEEIWSVVNYLRSIAKKK